MLADPLKNVIFLKKVCQKYFVYVILIGFWYTFFLKGNYCCYLLAIY